MVQAFFWCALISVTLNAKKHVHNTARSQRKFTSSAAVLPQNQRAQGGGIRHLAVVMDGNRRWAKKNKLHLAEGHRQGGEKLKALCVFCKQHAIEMVSVYALSLENLQRSEEELQDIYQLVIEEAQNSLTFYLQNSIRIRFIGDRVKFSPEVAGAVAFLEGITKDCSSLSLNILFCYGGRQEIVAAVQALLEDKKNIHQMGVITDDMFKQYMWTADLPDPEIVIRTGGCKRLSNFLPYQSIYSEIFFLDKLWPEISYDDLEGVLELYRQTTRSLGK